MPTLNLVNADSSVHTDHDRHVLFEPASTGKGRAGKGRGGGIVQGPGSDVPLQMLVFSPHVETCTVVCPNSAWTVIVDPES